MEINVTVIILKFLQVYLLVKFYSRVNSVFLFHNDEHNYMSTAAAWLECISYIHIYIYIYIYIIYTVYIIYCMTYVYIYIYIYVANVYYKYTLFMYIFSYSYVCTYYNTDSCIALMHKK